MTSRRATAVALLAKAPVPGQVKTRFSPPCSPEEAAAFARAFLEDTAAMLRVPAIAERIDAWCSYSGDPSLLTDIFETSLLLEQRGADLSERIVNATTDLFAKGYERVIVLCADCPTVEASYFEAALDSVERVDAVFGPAHDGGCVLVGLSRPTPAIFQIEMSTDRVFTEMVAVADSMQLASRSLPPRYDLDTISDLIDAITEGELRHAVKTTEMFKASRFAVDLV